LGTEYTPAVERLSSRGVAVVNGVFHRGIKEFVIERYGRDVWDDAREAAGIERQVYLPVDTRPDAEFISLVETVPGQVDESPFELLEEFGRFLTERLVDTYGARVIDDDWGSMDLLAGVERAIHEPLRSHNAELNPPKLAVSRDEHDQVTLLYESPRRLCPIAKGIALGVGDYFDDDLAISEERCMHRGDQQCEIVVTRQ
jgi:hypothetical protein